MVGVADNENFPFQVTGMLNVGLIYTEMESSAAIVCGNFMQNDKNING